MSSEKGWIKLHRKLLDNKYLYRDNTAMLLFVKILLVCDRKTGTYMTGRFVLAELMGMSPNTVYKALKRLEKNNFLWLDSNNKGTTIHLYNWAAYQDTSDDSGTTKEQQSNNKVTHNKKKELRIKKQEEYKETNKLVSSTGFASRTAENAESKSLTKGINYSQINETDKTLARLLHTLENENYGHLRPGTKSTAKLSQTLLRSSDSISKLHRLDGYDYETIETVLRWSQQDDFWKSNIRSGEKLRKQFEKLAIRIEEEKNGKPTII